MTQATLYAPDITCEHCIATIQRAVDTVEGARFVSGDPVDRSFVVAFESGAALDRLGAALAAEGYPLGEAGADEGSAAAGATAEGWSPAFRVTPTAAGADVNYDCDCGCDAGFALDRSRAEQPPEGCCCGKQMLVGRQAEARLRATLEGEAYRLEVREVTMPWGQPLEAALAIPLGGQ